MSSFTRVALAALASCALSATLSAAHASEVTYEVYSSLTNLQYTLTDLRPADGIAASVNFDNSGSFAFVGGLAVIDDVVNGTQVDVSIQAAGSPFNAAATSTFLRPDNTSATGYVAGSTLAASVRLTQAGQGFYAEGTAAAANVELTPNLDDTVLQPIQNTVVLAAHSQLTITGLAKYGLVNLGGGDCGACAMYFEARTMLVSSDAFTQFFDPAQDNGLIGRVDGLYDTFGTGAYGSHFQDASATQQLSLTFTNDSDEAKRFGFIATTWVQAETTAVPEPETWGLALAGLALAGAAARRRQR